LVRRNATGWTPVTNMFADTPYECLTLFYYFAGNLLSRYHKIGCFVRIGPLFHMGCGFYRSGCIVVLERILR
jgi:hypothetical protein